MPKKKKKILTPPKKDIVVKTYLTYEQLMKKALNTPLPKKNKN